MLYDLSAQVVQHEGVLSYNMNIYSRTTIEFYFVENDKKRKLLIQKSIFSLTDYPKASRQNL